MNRKFAKYVCKCGAKKFRKTDECPCADDKPEDKPAPKAKKSKA